MDTFPFTNDDWLRVKAATYAIVNATLADDEVVAESLFTVLQDVLRELRCKYGDHPILLETEADFSNEPTDSIRLYAAALNIAKDNNLPTDSICLSYASALIDSERHLAEARVILESCRDQIYANADESNIALHVELMSLLALRRNDKLE
jgi:hypothetical protein